MTETATESTFKITGEIVDGKLKLRLPKRKVVQMKEVVALCNALQQWTPFQDAALAVEAGLTNLIERLESDE